MASNNGRSVEWAAMTVVAVGTGLIALWLIRALASALLGGVINALPH